jgi:hypothetical protein
MPATVTLTMVHQQTTDAGSTLHGMPYPEPNAPWAALPPAAKLPRPFKSSDPLSGLQVFFSDQVSSTWPVQKQSLPSAPPPDLSRAAS